jgi:hypothetical protein
MLHFHYNSVQFNIWINLRRVVTVEETRGRASVVRSSLGGEVQSHGLITGMNSCGVGRKMAYKETRRKKEKLERIKYRTRYTSIPPNLVADFLEWEQ